MRGKRSRITATALAVLTATVVLWSAPAAAQTADADAKDPIAMAALDEMGAYLRTLQTFQVKAETTREDVLENGLKVQLNGVTNLLARKPDRLRINVESDLKERQYLYDGKEFTLWARRMNYYATVPAPPTIGELVDLLEEKYDIETPLVDLFRWGTTGASSAAITDAVYIGPSSVEGTTCQHFAFRQEGLDWQVWIQRGDFPLPRKLVLTTTTDEARPQFEATYTWDLAPSFNDRAFGFDPPANAQRIVIAQLPPASGKSN
jgi:hypothetical protein